MLTDIRMNDKGELEGRVVEAEWKVVDIDKVIKDVEDGENKTSEEYKEFLNWCEDKWTQEHKMQRLLSKLSNGDVDFLKDQYEARLNDDMVAILTELQLEIEETDSGCGWDGYIKKDVVNNYLQQKIDSLKGAKDDKTCI